MRTPKIRKLKRSRKKKGLTKYFILIAFILLIIYFVVLPYMESIEEHNTFADLSEDKMYEKEYVFEYDDKTWHINAKVLGKDLIEYRDNTNGIRDGTLLEYPKLVRNMFTIDVYMEDIYDQIKQQEPYITNEEYANLMVYFVQTKIDYCLDDDNYGKREYWALPWETLLIGKGDCEDKAILLSSLLKSANIEAKVVFTEEHALVAVLTSKPQVEKRHNIFTGKSTIKQGKYTYTFPNEAIENAVMEYNGKKYCLVECTAQSPIGCIDAETYKSITENYEIY